MSERLAQRVALVATIDPQDSGASQTTTCDVIDASLYDSLMFIMAIQAITSSGASKLTIYKGTKATVGSITTSVTSVSLTEKMDNKQMIVDVDVSNEGSYRYYKAQVVENASGTTTGKICVMVLGSKARFHPASDNDLSSVESITYA